MQLCMKICAQKVLGRKKGVEIKRGCQWVKGYFPLGILIGKWTLRLQRSGFHIRFRLTNGVELRLSAKIRIALLLLFAGEEPGNPGIKLPDILHAVKCCVILN